MLSDEPVASSRSDALEQTALESSLHISLLISMASLLVRMHQRVQLTIRTKVNSTTSHSKISSSVGDGVTNEVHAISRIQKLLKRLLHSLEGMMIKVRYELISKRLSHYKQLHW